MHVPSVTVSPGLQTPPKIEISYCNENNSYDDYETIDNEEEEEDKHNSGRIKINYYSCGNAVE